MNTNAITMRAAEDGALRGMTPRVKALYDTIERRKYQKQRAFGGDLSVLTDETVKRSTAYRRSLAVERVLGAMPIDILPEDLIVGCTQQDGVIVRCMLPRYLLAAEAGKETVRVSHKAPNYALLLEKGLQALMAEVEAEREGVDDPQWADLSEGMIREARAVIGVAERYADLAAAQAAALPEGDARKAELLEIARVCRKVPAHPADSLREALQSVWFLNQAYFQTQCAFSIGCLDRIVAPYFERDVAGSRITLAEAQELVDCFCLRVNDRAQMDPANYVVDQRALQGASEQSALCYDDGFVTEAENDSADAINHWGQNILISGLLPDGSDATSAITYMVLNAHEKFHMTSPVLTVRMHKGSPQPLVRRVAEVLKQGGGMPYINNDDIIVPAYEALGVDRADACNYANSNCWETLLQGTSSQEMIRGINFLYYLELALNRGEPFVYGDIVKAARPVDPDDSLTWPVYVCVYNDMVSGVDTGAAAEFASFEDLMRAWKTQMDYMLQATMDRIARAVKGPGAMGPGTALPLVSLLQLDCVKNHRDVTRLGPRYTLWHLMAEAVSNAADALYAIKKWVYDERRIALPDLVAILKANWQTEGGEALRTDMLLDAQKFGNDEDQVDALAQEMVDYFLERGALHAEQYAPEILFPPCIGTFSWIISIGKRIGASADGRLSQDPIAANMSPVPGRDVSGPTAALNSYLKLNTKPMAAGAPIDLRVSSSGLEGDEGTARIAGLIRVLLERGGNMMTLTMTSVEELKRAIENPDAYRGLRVRMGGWSAYFTMLSKESQRIHLKRVEHGLA